VNSKKNKRDSIGGVTTDLSTVMIKAKPNENKCKYRGGFMVWCCKDAFSGTHECD